MADNTPSLNNGQLPFRRYEPPMNPGSVPGKVTPLSPPTMASAESGAKPSRASQRRQRNARGRWRQWIQQPSADQAAAKMRPRPPSQSANAGSASSGVKSPPPRRSPEIVRSRSGPPPSNGSQRVNEPSAFVKQPSGAAPRSPQSPYPPSSNPRPQTPPSPGGQNKVTPLRRQPVWSSPDVPPGGPTKARRGKRRPVRKAPQPIVYGIRLLILGTGIAAIAGTVLSSLKPSNEAALTSSAGQDNAETLVGNAFRQNQTEDLTQPLSLAEELVTLETDLVALESMTPGLTQSVFLYDLETGNYIDLNGRESVSAASTIKIPILVAFLQAVDNGAVQLHEAVTLQEDMIAGGSGDLQVQEVGTQYTALEVATEMIINSDNTATNMMIDLLGGTEVLNQQFRAWGMESTLLRNVLPDLEGTNTTSSADLVRVMALVDEGKLLSIRSRDRFFGIMQRTYNRTLIPDGLGDNSALAYNKTGDIGTALGDVALVDVMNGKRYIVSVLVDRPFNDGRASELIRRTAGRIHEEMSQPISPTGLGSAPTAPADVMLTEEEAMPTESPDPSSVPELEMPIEGTPPSNPEIPPG